MAKQDMGEEQQEDDEVITAVYKINLHCEQCAREIKKPLIRTQGVHGVDIDTESGEIKVKGKFDPQKIQDLIEKKSKKRADLVSPLPKIKKVEEKIDEEKKDKEPIYSASTMKVHMHCGKCEYDLKKELFKLKGVYSVNTDIKAQTVKVDGTIDPQNIIKFIQENLHKHAEIIATKKAVTEQKKEKMKEVDDKFVEPTKEVKEQKKEKMKEVDDKFVEPTKEVKEQKKEKEKEVDIKSIESTKEEKEPKKEKKKEVEVKSIESTGNKNSDEQKVVVEVRVKVQEPNVPYMIHHVYAPNKLFSDEYPPQLFSDENPNACTIM